MFSASKILRSRNFSRSLIWLIEQLLARGIGQKLLARIVLSLLKAKFEEIRNSLPDLPAAAEAAPTTPLRESTEARPGRRTGANAAHFRSARTPRSTEEPAEDPPEEPPEDWEWVCYSPRPPRPGSLPTRRAARWRRRPPLTPLIVSKSQI